MAPAKYRRTHHDHYRDSAEGIRQEFAALKPASVTLDGNRTMSVKEAVFALAPTLERMKKRGFDTQEIVERLHEKNTRSSVPDPRQIPERVQTATGRTKGKEARHTPGPGIHRADGRRRKAFCS